MERNNVGFHKCIGSIFMFIFSSEKYGKFWYDPLVCLVHKKGDCIVKYIRNLGFYFVSIVDHCFICK